MPSMSDLRIRHEIIPADIPMLSRLWADLGWGTDGEEGQNLVRQALAGSSWVAIAEQGGQFAGYARALSDGVLVTYLVEVAVMPALRRQGIGEALILSCLDSFRHTSVYADAFPDIVGLNTRLGLLPRPSHLTACARGPVASNPASSS